MAGTGRTTVFEHDGEFNTVMSLAYGPPALLGLVVRRTPSSLASRLVRGGPVVGVLLTFCTGSGPGVDVCSWWSRLWSRSSSGASCELPDDGPMPTRAPRAFSSVGSTRRWTWPASSARARPDRAGLSLPQPLHRVSWVWPAACRSCYRCPGGRGRDRGRLRRDHAGPGRCAGAREGGRPAAAGLSIPGAASGSGDEPRHANDESRTRDPQSRRIPLAARQGSRLGASPRSLARQSPSG